MFSTKSDLYVNCMKTLTFEHEYLIQVERHPMVHFIGLAFTTLGSLHTQAKSRDHEIVRAQKKVSKCHPKTPPKYVVWSWILKCSVKSYVLGPSTKYYFNEFLFMQVLTMIE
jgi:hypothetical protein